MPSEYDATEFVDADFQLHKNLSAAASASARPQRAPTREEVDSQVAEAQQKLSELKRAQEDLERERAELEESRRRQIEFQTGRQEMAQHLTRGLGLLEEAEFSARRDAEQMSKTIAGLRDALSKVQAIHEESWTKDNFNVELTRALTTIENARMEWNSARLKFVMLSGATEDASPVSAPRDKPAETFLAGRNFAGLCRMGLALTWPLAAVALLALILLVLVLLRH